MRLWARSNNRTAAAAVGCHCCPCVAFFFTPLTPASTFLFPFHSFLFFFPPALPPSSHVLRLLSMRNKINLSPPVLFFLFLFLTRSFFCVSLFCSLRFVLSSLPLSLPRAALVHASIGAAPSSQPATSARPTLSDSVDIRSCLIHSTTCSNRNTLCSARARGRSCVSARWPLILQFMVDVNMRPRPCIWPAANFGANCCKS